MSYTLAAYPLRHHVHDVDAMDDTSILLVLAREEESTITTSAPPLEWSYGRKRKRHTRRVRAYTCELHVFPTIEKCRSNRKWPCSSHPHAPPGPGPCRQPPLGPTCQPEPKADRPKGTREVGDVSERVALIHGSFPSHVLSAHPLINSYYYLYVTTNSNG